MRISWRGLAALAILAGIATIVVTSQTGSSEPQTARLPSAEREAARSAEAVAAPVPTAQATDGVQGRLAELEKRTAESPSDLEALTELAGIYFETRSYPRAADTFAAALELQPENARLRTDLAGSLLYQGMLGMARREYLRAIAADPALPDPHFYLAVILSHGNPQDIPSAVAEWREVIRLAPDSDLARTSQEYLTSYAAQEQAKPAASP